jgi:hypothetical protein
VGHMTLTRTQSVRAVGQVGVTLDGPGHGHGVSMGHDLQKMSAPWPVEIT